MSYYKKLKTDLAAAGIFISLGVVPVAAHNRDKIGHNRSLVLLDLVKKI